MPIFILVLLLSQTASESANVTVAQDGSGDYTSIGEAIATAPNRSIVRYLTFENTAGPDHHQAVAVRCGSDSSIFYRCRFRGYQDTLYINYGIQFYRECDIEGTIDFIFGDATALFQNCNIYARRPLPGQVNVLTAQGRYKQDKSGISLHNCTIMPAADADLSGVKTYLGRPWKDFSRTVIMQSTIYSLIDPAGWLQWDNRSASLDSIYYREYQNRGPGSDTTRRVSWRGVGVMGSSSEAMEFTAGRFINGKEWLPSRGVPYFLDLIKGQLS